MASKKWNSVYQLVFFLLAAGLGIYWGLQLRQSFYLQYESDWDQLLGFFRWLLGYVFILFDLFLLGWFNFVGPHRWWGGKEGKKWIYRSWILFLFFGFYLFLHWQTAFQVDLTEENLLIASLGILFVMGFTFVASLVRSRNQQTKLLQQQTSAELQALRSQLNPHFLFNALNTIYSQAVPLEDESLATRIQELSGILRFSLQQAQKEMVPIEEEIAFLERYIALQSARLAHPKMLHVHIHWDQSEAQIPPLLLLPFVENVFKYGIDSRGLKTSKISLVLEDGTLRFSTQNPISQQSQKGTGKGIEQVKRRLALRYPDQHQLTIEEKKGRFFVELTMDLALNS